MKKTIQLFAACCMFPAFVFAQKTNDVVTPLHAMKVDYPVPYEAPTKENVKKVKKKRGK